MEDPDFAKWRDSYSWYFKRRAAMYIADLTAAIGQPPRSAIEIGCSTGESLEALASAYPGVACRASDLSAASIRVARQHYPEVEFTVGVFPENDEPADLLMAFHVVEHVPDIASLRQQLAARINRGGLLYIRVPNFGALSRRLFGSRWPDLVPEHVHYFTRSSLVAWLRAGEFEPLSVTTRGSSWQWMAGLKRLVTAKRGQSASANGHPQQRVLQTIVVADRLLAPLLAVEGRAGVGSELIVIARQP
ncbi:MAG: class I SAM-dependent methyltransferase [Rhodospirillales bacterium]